MFSKTNSKVVGKSKRRYKSEELTKLVFVVCLLFAAATQGELRKKRKALAAISNDSASRCASLQPLLLIAAIDWCKLIKLPRDYITNISAHISIPS